MGGFFTEHLSWRWIFYINLPLGIAAFLVIGSVLHLPRHRTEHRIDWLGAVLLVIGVTSLLMVTVWGGNEYAWGSAEIIGLTVLGVATLAAFVWQELRAPEPMVSMDLFRNRVFTITSGIGFVVGFAMFGSIVYLSIYLQVVNGSSPTVAGLQLLPLMAGLLFTSILSGRLITRTGNYKPYPIIGTALATAGLLLLSQLSSSTPYWQTAIAMLVLGAGLGNVMQVLVLAVQNSVEPRDIGTATSGSTFFRSMGGAFGTAVFGAVWAARLATEMSAVMPLDREVATRPPPWPTSPRSLPSCRPRSWTPSRAPSPPRSLWRFRSWRSRSCLPSSCPRSSCGPVTTASRPISTTSTQRRSRPRRGRCPDGPSTGGRISGSGEVRRAPCVVAAP